MNQLFFLIATVFLVVSVVRFIYAPETSNTQAGLATAFFCVAILLMDWFRSAGNP